MFSDQIHLASGKIARDIENTTDSNIFDRGQTNRIRRRHAEGRTFATLDLLGERPVVRRGGVPLRQGGGEGRGGGCRPKRKQQHPPVPKGMAFGDSWITQLPSSWEAVANVVLEGRRKTFRTTPSGSQGVYQRTTWEAKSRKSISTERTLSSPVRPQQHLPALTAGHPRRGSNDLVGKENNSIMRIAKLQSRGILTAWTTGGAIRRPSLPKRDTSTPGDAGRYCCWFFHPGNAEGACQGFKHKLHGSMREPLWIPS